MELQGFKGPGERQHLFTCLILSGMKTKLLKQVFACANTAKCVAALEMISCIWQISWDRLGKNLTWVCPKPLSWKTEDIWMPLTISVLTFLPPEKWAALFCQKTLTLLVEASAVPTGHPGPGDVALLGLWGMFWNYRCSPLLLFALAMLPSFGSHLAELPQA